MPMAFDQSACKTISDCISVYGGRQTRGLASNVKKQHLGFYPCFQRYIIAIFMHISLE